MRRLLSIILVVILAVGGSGLWWTHQPLSLRTPVVDLSIEPGTSARGVAQDAVDAGVLTSPHLLYWWFRLSGDSRRIRAGSYELQGDVTPRSLLSKLVRGEEALRAVTLVEGLTFKQFRQILQKAEQLAPDTQGLAPDLIMQKLERPGIAPEGRFYPDTYTYTKGSSDLAVLQRALHAMDRHLDAAWQTRQSDNPLKTPEELLILASIIEKETGRASDRAMIASVFTNRLRIGMMLQTDPTVIYGLGDKFDGNLRRRDLLADTPWNTYTRAGLPPTPISMPGKASLLAAAQPAKSRALYFVAKGDGNSQFSESLDAHNRAVSKYQLGR
ncbi:endolytic transglycosylase MltG [Rhodoferax antarcticus]|uniref:Endolytic murein transglycosylase n=1 Tax=Rhodoferax antarcticus ANT.BR TaxID=1111071 RepID=A0A1Q8YBE4_9BURK|nr:endolytic transglycosylase MltG [Rhodoferax antarcticus]APW46757.1 aminodeoxychorismate lyase [Rhodoferax antarcticus]OLP05229.1 aminodeoxychorismate lyase family protein [Rhodoferax antarcticus ANT.BR]